MFPCHCSRCRRQTETVYGATVFLEGGSLRFDADKAPLTAYSLLGARKKRVFCKFCSSPMPRLESPNTIPCQRALSTTPVSLPRLHTFTAIAKPKG